MASARRLLPLLLTAAVSACQSPSPRQMLDRLPRQAGLVHLRGQPVTLLGRLPEAGDPAPDAVLGTVRWPSGGFTMIAPAAS